MLSVSSGGKASCSFRDKREGDGFSCGGRGREKQSKSRGGEEKGFPAMISREKKMSITKKVEDTVEAGGGSADTQKKARALKSDALFRAKKGKRQKQRRRCSSATARSAETSH